MSKHIRVSVLTCFGNRMEMHFLAWVSLSEPKSCVSHTGAGGTAQQPEGWHCWWICRAQLGSLKGVCVFSLVQTCTMSLFARSWLRQGSSSPGPYGCGAVPAVTSFTRSRSLSSGPALSHQNCQASTPASFRHGWMTYASAPNRTYISIIQWLVQLYIWPLAHPLHMYHNLKGKAHWLRSGVDVACLQLILDWVSYPKAALRYATPQHTTVSQC